jgi:hypothetical protein
MGESKVDDSKLDVLAERLSAALDDLKEMKGKVDSMHVLGTKLAGLEKDVAQVNRKVDIALQKSDAMDKLFMTLKEDVIQPIRADIVEIRAGTTNNRKWWRTILRVAVAVPALTAWAGFQWKPWQGDIDFGVKRMQDQFDTATAKRDDQLKKYSEDVGKELQNDDRRITVLEFRANNVDGKSSK